MTSGAKALQDTFSISSNRIRIPLHIGVISLDLQILMHAMCVLFHLSIWTCATYRILPEYDLMEFSWKREKACLSPIWMTLPEASKSLHGIGENQLQT